MKIAIYGGSFNPVHNEHVNIVKAAVSALNLDKVVVLPTAITPDKTYVMTAKARDRLKMCRLAFAEVAQAEVSDYEIKRGGVSYSYVTCRHFRKLYPHDELYFLIGGDSLAKFDRWKKPEEILKCVTLAVCAREDTEALKSEIVRIGSLFKREIVSINYVGKAVSSTKIRVLAALGEDVSDFVPNAVKQHILRGQLYLIPKIGEVKKYLTEERYAHTLRVAACAARNAPRARVYEFDAVVAAALHDVAKYLGADAEELKGFTPPRDVPPPVLHQYSGAYVAEHTFGISDETILNAIRYHASGRENMSALEKLIYLADLLEDGRKFDGVDKLRLSFARDIDRGLSEALGHQLKYLKSTGEPIYGLTVRAYEFIKNNGGF